MKNDAKNSNKTKDKVDEYVEGKALEIYDIVHHGKEVPIPAVKRIIGQIINDRRVRADKEWIQDLLYLCDDISNGELPIDDLYEKLKEAGMEVEE